MFILAIFGSPSGKLKPAKQHVAMKLMWYHEANVEKANHHGSSQS